nr:S8 family serine peptidase [Synechococcus sp. KORDI-100]
MSKSLFETTIQKSNGDSGPAEWDAIERFGSTELLNNTKKAFIEFGRSDTSFLTDSKGKKLTIKQVAYTCIAADQNQKENKLALRHKNDKKIQIWDFDKSLQLIKKNKPFKTSSKQLAEYEAFFSQSLLPQSSLIETEPIDEDTGFSWAANEPLCKHQHGLFNRGTYKGAKEGADIGADDYFKTISEPLQYISQDAGGRGTIAVIDTGVNLTHEDLKDTIKLNGAESINGLDDDGNGLIDDLMGYDFVNDDNDPNDDNGHGSHVAGIAAAKANEVGLLGVNPEARVLAIKVMDQHGNGNTSDVIRGVDYAVSRNAKVINLSLATNYNDPSLQLAMEIADSKGFIQVVAAGNEGKNIDQEPVYPASYDLEGIISVGASDIDDSIAPSRIEELNPSTC